MSHYEVTDGPLLLSTDPDRLDLEFVREFLAGSYWAPDIALDTVRRSVRHSIAFGVYRDGHPVGFARVISDRATFAYLADVFVVEEWRGSGVGDWMMQGIIGHPELQGLRRWLLATRGAHAFYARHGFVPLPNPERWMQRPGEPDHESA